MILRLPELQNDEPADEHSDTELGTSICRNRFKVLLIELVDGGIFAGTTKADDLIFAAISKVAADLVISLGRGPQEADELIDWMSSNKRVWRTRHLELIDSENR